MDDLNSVFNNDIDSEVESTEETEQVNDSKEESKEPEADKANEEVAEPTEQQEGEKQESDEPPASTNDKDTKSEPEESWTKTAVLDERRKRQELERKIQELETKFNQPAPQEKVEEEVPDPIDDPVGYKNYVKDSLKQEIFLERVNETKAEMQAKHDDYSEMEKKFIELSNDNPALAQKLRQVSNPAKFAYDTAKNHFETQKYSDPNYKANLREELKKEILAELVKNQNSGSKPTPSVDLPDLSNRTSADSNVTQKIQYKGTLEEVFPDSSDF